MIFKKGNRKKLLKSYTYKSMILCIRNILCKEMGKKLLEITQTIQILRMKCFYFKVLKT